MRLPLQIFSPGCPPDFPLSYSRTLIRAQAHALSPPSPSNSSPPHTWARERGRRRSPQPSATYLPLSTDLHVSKRPASPQQHTFPKLLTCPHGTCDSEVRAPMAPQQMRSEM
eukprot:6193998-Pleurochrysis_carterae.AAC.5